MIGIIDYGMGNLGSVANALEHLGVEAEMLDAPTKVSAHDRLLLPGVGSFRLAMDRLDSSGWTTALRAHCSAGMPLLGICLGMQLLFDSGEEHGFRKGLGLVPGRVVPLDPMLGLRVPQVGWNGLDFARRHPLFRGVKESVDFYFVHSFHCIPNDTADIVATCEYGLDLVASVARQNVAGMQFHPEKSQDFGLKLLSNFVDWDPAC
jgi:imidazole glycerol-phosphate synthase subunit HisH